MAMGRSASGRRSSGRTFLFPVSVFEPVESIPLLYFPDNPDYAIFDRHPATVSRRIVGREYEGSFIIGKYKQSDIQWFGHVREMRRELEQLNIET